MKNTIKIDDKKEVISLLSKGVIYLSDISERLCADSDIVFYAVHQKASNIAFVEGSDKI